MKALIIAAGQGERFRPLTYREPKPLIPLLGLRLIERVILSAREAGVNDFVIVVGYMGGKLMDFLGDGSRYGVKISYVWNKFWRLGNGVSVYEARHDVGDRFVLLMSDHIFNPKILSTLLKSKLNGDACLLCVDTEMRYVFDFDDATKVKVVNGLITDIGKNLREFNGVDMGIFLCSRLIFKALDKSIRKGRYSLTDGARILAEWGKLEAYPVNGEENYWIDIDTPKNLRIAEEILTNNQRTRLDLDLRLRHEQSMREYLVIDGS